MLISVRARRPKPEQTVLLLITCAWIFWEATHRLLFHKAEIEVTWWSFGVMLVSIVIDASRSRALARTAKKYNSQALEADALHFQTDIWRPAGTGATGVQPG